MLKALLFLAAAFAIFAVVTTVVGLLVGLVWTILKWAFVVGLIAAVLHHVTRQKT